MRKSDKESILLAAEILHTYCNKRKRCWTNLNNKGICPFLVREDGNRCLLARIPGKFELEKIEEAIKKL